MVTYNDIKTTISKKELIEKVDEMVFFLGADVTDNNAVIVAGFIDILHILRGCINGEPTSVENLLSEITEIAYYLGAEMDATNWPFVQQSINTLYEAKKLLEQ